MNLDKTLEDLVHQKHLHLSNLRETAILLLGLDPCKKLDLLMRLAPQHDQWLKTVEKERSSQLRQHDRQRDYGLEL